MRDLTSSTNTYSLTAIRLLKNIVKLVAPLLSVSYFPAGHVSQKFSSCLSNYYVRTVWVEALMGNPVHHKGYTTAFHCWWLRVMKWNCSKWQESLKARLSLDTKPAFSALAEQASLDEVCERDSEGIGRVGEKNSLSVWDVSGRTWGKGSSRLQEDYWRMSQQPTSKMSVSLPAHKTHQGLYFFRFSLLGPAVCLPLARVCAADGL